MQNAFYKLRPNCLYLSQVFIFSTLKLDTYAILKWYLFSSEKETVFETETQYLPYHIDFIADYIDIVFKCILGKLFVLILIQNWNPATKRR